MEAAGRLDCMLWTIVVLLLLLWLLGFTMKIAGGLIHILLVIALVVVVFRLLTGRRVV
jgi:hypothetical protein